MKTLPAFIALVLSLSLSARGQSNKTNSSQADRRDLFTVCADGCARVCSVSDEIRKDFVRERVWDGGCCTRHSAQVNDAD